MIEKRLITRCLQLVADEVKMGQIETRQAVGRHDKEVAQNYTEAMTDAFRVIYELAEAQAALDKLREK